VGIPEWKRPVERPMDIIKMDLREIGWCGMDWIDLAQDRNQWRAFVNTVMNHRVPRSIGKCWWLHNWQFLQKVSAQQSQSVSHK
jgi:hypothetical protein